MTMVLLTAIGVGGATIFGALVGFIFKNISHKFSDIVLSFAAGVMLAAAILGLILPALEYGSSYGTLNCLIMTVAGIFTGALALNLIDKLVPHLHKLVGVSTEDGNKVVESHVSKVILFVTAIAIHNLPEGIAAGVGFGSGDTSQAITIAAGIALQNIRYDNRTCRGGGNFPRLFRGNCLNSNTSLCPCLCRRHNAVCNKR